MFSRKNGKTAEAVVKSIFLSKKEILRIYHDYESVLNGRDPIRLHFGNFCVFDPYGQFLVKSTILRVERKNVTCL